MRQWLAGVVVGAVAGGLTAACVVLVLGAPVTRAAPQDQVQQLLRVRALEVVDADGAPRALLFVDSQGVVGLSLQDQDGNQRLSLNVRRDLVNMAMSEPNAERSVTLVLAQPGQPPTPELGLSDRGAAVSLDVARSLTDGGSRSYVVLTAAPDTSPGGLVVLGADGGSVWSAP